MPVGRSYISQQVGKGLVIGSLVESLSGSEHAQGLDSVEARISKSRSDARANGGQISDGTLNDSPRSPFGLTDADYAIKATAIPPSHMYIQSVDRPKEVVAAQFNPEKLKEMISTQWNRFDVPGLSHQPLQYGYTNNNRIEFELVFDAGKARQPIKVTMPAKIRKARDQLKAWHYLRRPDDLGGIGDTQRLLFVWPNFGTMTCVLVSTSLDYEAFNSIGQLTAFRAQVQLEQIRDTIVYSDEFCANPLEDADYERLL